MRRRSLSSVKIISIDATKVRRHVDDYARELLATHPEVEEIIVFGSFENETYAPGSDIDLFLVLCQGMIRRAIAFPDFYLPNRSACRRMPFHSPKRKSLSCLNRPF